MPNFASASTADGAGSSGAGSAAEPTTVLAEDNDAPDAPARVQLSRTAERVVAKEAEKSDEGEHQVMQVYDPTDPDVIQGEPTEPGCYYRSPTGCWQRPMKNTRWRHDVQIENHPELNEAHCVGRKVWWDEYCGTIDAKVKYVPGAEGEADAQKKQAPEEESPSGADADAPQLLGEGKLPLQAMGSDPDEVQGHPSEPGCYIRMPGGCTLHAFRSDNWRHDVSAEDDYVDEASCLARHSFWNSYCGSSDAELLFLGDPVMSEAVAKPNILSAVGIKQGKSGDLLLLQKQPAPPVDGLHLLQLGAAASEGQEWQWPWGEKLKKPKQKAPEANLARGAVKSVTIESYPTQPGCYMRMPSGCPRRPLQTQLWRHDTWAEKQEVNETGCHERKQVWDTYCGTTDASIVWVTLSFSAAASASTSPQPVAALQLAAEQEWPWKKKKQKDVTKEAQLARADTVAETVPSDPGCYMKMPSGCPRRPMDTNLWRHDTWAEKQNFTESQCGQRKAVWDKYCGADDAKVVFVASGSS